MPGNGHSRFAQFIAPHLEVLYRAGHRLCRNRADAEDLVQDVCMRALGTWRREPIESPRAWLLRIAFRLHVDGVRRAASRRAYSLDADDRVEPAAERGAPDDSAETSLRLEALDAVWAELNADQQALLALYAEGYRLSEIAEIAELPLTALKARLHRARVRLGKLIEQRNQQRRPHAAMTGDAS